MKEKSLLWISVLLLMSGMLCACSSHEEDETSTLCGYWKVISDNQNEIKDNNSQGGLCFKNDGEIIEWAMNSESWYSWLMSMKVSCALSILLLRNCQRPILSFAVGEASLVHHVKKAMMWNI